MKQKLTKCPFKKQMDMSGQNKMIMHGSGTWYSLSLQTFLKNHIIYNSSNPLIMHRCILFIYNQHLTQSLASIQY